MHLSEFSLDICVADYHSNTVVDFNQSGELQFRFTKSQRSFQPCGIATNSQSRILISYFINNNIQITHILNQVSTLPL